MLASESDEFSLEKKTHTHNFNDSRILRNANSTYNSPSKYIVSCGDQRKIDLCAITAMLYLLVREFAKKDSNRNQSSERMKE